MRLVASDLSVTPSFVIPVAPPAFDLAVIVPTRDEAANVGRIVAALDAALSGLRAEIVFVDDWSRDGTAERIEALARDRGDIRVIRRFGRKGLSSAVIEGALATMAPVVAVIDGDGQHDETIIAELYALVANGDADVAIGSRYCSQGSTGAWEEGRLRASRLATGLSQRLVGTHVTDPMSGFFAIRRDTLITLVPNLSGRGFKILFDLLSTSDRPLRVAERPYCFRQREHGESKLGAGVVIDFALMLADRTLRRYFPSRFVLFACVGTLGLGVHLAVLRLLLDRWDTGFATAQTAAVLTAIAFNFLVNNAVTFRDRRLRGGRLALGLASFYAACGLGALANIGVADLLFAEHHRWWVAGVAGALVGAVWNFSAASVVTWRKR